MRILGIETSCDETAAAVVEGGTKILSNVVASSAEMHAKTGGIIPEQAARQQVKSILPVLQNALLKAESSKRNIEAIAVTVGPGLIGSLLVGVETAKTLAYIWKKPIIPVNHLVAHIYANFISVNSKSQTLNSKQFKNSNLPEFPALALVVSGGHTDLVLMHNHGKLTWIGGTRDDAAGEAFDKSARLLGLSYPGGVSISKEAEKFNKSSIINHKSLNLFPRPLINEDNFDFSFSGLKTAVAREVKGKRLKVKDRQMLAAEIQEAIVDVLVDKTLKAVEKYQPKSLLLAGGVAANQRLRHKFELGIMNYESGVKLFIPDHKLCTDNAAVIASCAYFNNHPVDWRKVDANPELIITGFQTSYTNSPKGIKT
ncbi:tRNA (adenosine(37)-N6)-threonylcarbamoyltransferase complex transferase subunit TsaD [Candidatus Woesebacteria bacterium]|nr:tRNA (adenosine(37)-N6)-threonylcarbamoyltransferase complex transferase subunit TsaD [Candidatus Woesebacteria bacterium]